MCDYSLMHVKSRAANVGDKLVTTQFPNASTKGFSAVDDCETAVCVLPGTEIAFDAEIQSGTFGMFYGTTVTHPHKVARFRQVEKEHTHRHHDALELPDGTIIKLHDMRTGQSATVLQLPAAPRTEQEAQDQTRLEVVG